MMSSLKLTPSGNAPPSCRYLCTASRPVYTTPLISTSSPTLSARILSSVKGRESLVMSVKPFGDFAVVAQGHALPPVSPAHVTDAHEERRRQPVRRANLHPQQGRLAAET